jgi:hypothetical protein
VFEPRREHGRFCSARCRVARNREINGDRAVEGSALDWSLTAMRDATGRLQRARASDRARAFAVIGEAVWWVTIVDGTLVRYHPDAYDDVLRDQPSSQRGLIEETLAGLRFVRNRMGRDLDHVDFIHLEQGAPRTKEDRVKSWRWAAIPAPQVSWLTPRGQAWEMERFRAYRARLAGNSVGQTFDQAAGFLEIAAEHAAATADHIAPEVS